MQIPNTCFASFKSAISQRAVTISDVPLKMPHLSEWVPPVYWLITIIDCTASSDTSRLIWFVFSFLLSPHLCSLQASRHKWQLRPFSSFFPLLFKIVAIAHPFQISQNPTRYSSYVWTIVQTGTHLSHDGSLSLVLLAWYPR